MWLMVVGWYIPCWYRLFVGAVKWEGPAGVRRAFFSNYFYFTGLAITVTPSIFLVEVVGLGWFTGISTG